MIAPFSWIDHNGQDVLFVDYSNLSGEQLLRKIKRVATAFEEMAQHHSGRYIAMINARDMCFDKNVLSVFKHNAVRFKPRMKRVAVVGIAGIKKLFFQTISTFSSLELKVFDTKEEALRWLTEQPTDDAGRGRGINPNDEFPLNLDIRLPPITKPYSQNKLR